MTTNDLEKTISALEQARGTALVQEDWEALSSLMASELIHIHANGAVEDREAYLEGVRTRLAFKSFERESLKVGGSGNHAIATGVLKQTVIDRASRAEFDIRVITTQVWIKEGDTWRQTSFHATHLPKT